MIEQTIPPAPNPIPPEVFPVHNTPRHKYQTPLFLIAGILILVILSGLTYLFQTKNQFPSQTSNTSTAPTPTNNLMVNWQNYTNTTFNFSINYPKEWRQETRKEVFGLIGDQILLTPSSIESQGKQEPGIFISIVENTNNYSSKQYLEKIAIKSQKGSTCEGNQKIISDIHNTFNNIDAIIAENFCGVLDQGPRLYVSKGNIVIAFSSSFTNQITNQDRDLTLQILSTFRFLDQPTPTITLEAIHCGGFTGALCPAGYSCEYPKTGGTLGKCIKR